MTIVIGHVAGQYKCVIHFRKSNIFDNMMSIMERYASNLEGIVAERTAELVEEKKRTDSLLNRMLPP